MTPHEMPQEQVLPPVEEMKYNEAGLPIRPGGQMCSNYIRSGKCSYGSTCKYNHPEGLAGLMAGPRGFGEFPGMLAASTEGPMPRRPGKDQCPFLKRTGSCPFGPECRFDHIEGLEDAGETVLRPLVPAKKDSGLGGVRGRRRFGPNSQQ